MCFKRNVHGIFLWGSEEYSSWGRCMAPSRGHIPIEVYGSDISPLYTTLPTLPDSCAFNVQSGAVSKIIPLQVPLLFAHGDLLHSLMCLHG